MVGYGKRMVSFVISCLCPGCVVVDQRKGVVNFFISWLCPGCVMVVRGSGSYLRIFVSMSGLCCGRFGKGLVSFVVSCPYPVRLKKKDG